MKKKYVVFLIMVIALLGFAAAVPALENNAKAKNFTLMDLDGKSVSLDNYKGKVVVLNFWASWCPPCKAEMPEFNDMDKEFKKSGEVVLLAVNMTDGRRETKKTATGFIKENKYGMKVLFDEKGTAAGIYSIQYLPTTYVIDAKGFVRGQIIGGTTKEAVMKLVREAQ
ncbi:MAG: TlpA family protein disulfide reductase [Synergistaceae bacterium]|nr:TlpA family protein disulfide reductase [Synergistaceae bacterium]